ncbi:MAG: phytanoyl-CoA dioxygenase family protein [Nocardiopsaceae bacterium]|nr:phytanoyl-CoA dioxygenase family protein [Nocardiopsaceae bacterium]
MLTGDEIAAFVEDGFVAIRGAVPGDIVRECQDMIWSRLAEQGLRRDEPGTWNSPVVRIPCPEGGPFAAAGTRPLVREACDQLIGRGRWLPVQGLGGTIPVRFPSAEDPGDAGWHLEASYEKNGGWRVNIRSRARGLLALYLFTEVDADSAPTRIRPGSHRDAARVLAPAGEEGMAWMDAAQAAAKASEHRPTVLATGQAGDVFLCHPFLVHAASWPHTGTAPKLMAQPGVLLHDQFPLTGPLAPAERPIAEQVHRAAPKAIS